MYCTLSVGTAVIIENITTWYAAWWMVLLQRLNEYEYAFLFKHVSIVQNVTRPWLAIKIKTKINLPGSRHLGHLTSKHRLIETERMIWWWCSIWPNLNMTGSNRSQSSCDKSTTYVVFGLISTTKDQCIQDSPINCELGHLTYFCYYSKLRLLGI